MCWHLILEDFGTELKYINCENNVVADTLSYLEIIENHDFFNISELHGYDENYLPYSAYPIHYNNIYNAQKLMLN